ncbi:MAG: ABC transporter ATP-binding protein/permease [Anaerolineae bacterium]|nr:ABC transporter ATP-binding protein/permease [Anaerolineae bacterium]
MKAESATSTASGQVLQRCLSYLRPYWPFVVASYLLLLVNNGITLEIPLVIRSIVDRGIKGGEYETILRGTLMLIGLALARGLFTYLSGRWTEAASQNVAYDLRNAIHDKLQSLSFSYHDRAETGQLLTRAISDVDRVRFLTGRAIVRLVEVTVLVVGIGASMMLMHLQLALLTLTVVPLLIYNALRFGTRFRPLSRTIQQQMSTLTTHLEQNLRGARIVKAFAQEQAEIARFDEENAALLALNLSAARMQALNLPLMRLIASLGTVIILLYGGQLVIQGRLTIGQLVAFTTYVGQLLVPIRRLGMIVPAIAHATASGERVFEILDAEAEVRELPGARPLGPVRGHVRFEHVHFAYFGRHKVLSDIDFEVQPGEVVALLGATGSGKSSIINLIPRFYDPTAGRILIDGQDIRYVTLSSLREQIGIVLQDTILFATSVRENIAFGCPHASEEEIVAAAKAASAHDFIMELPQQYDTLVGERGVTLSGGQKQRLAIARALLKNPRILILDDATSSVDTETEALIQAALSRLMEGRTTFIIAQRLSTIRRADHILVLDRGRIVAHGRRTAEHTAHDELLRISGLYAEIYYRQLRPQEEVR